MPVLFANPRRQVFWRRGPYDKYHFLMNWLFSQEKDLRTLQLANTGKIIVCFSTAEGDKNSEAGNQSKHFTRLTPDSYFNNYLK